MKNRSIKVLLIASAMLSVSVMAMARDVGATVVVMTDHQDHAVSKIEPLEGYGAFSFLHDTSADLVQYDLSFERNYTLIEYVVGKVQNKALPLSKKLWLFNCQIALK